MDDNLNMLDAECEVVGPKTMATPHDVRPDLVKDVNLTSDHKEEQPIPGPSGSAGPCPDDSYSSSDDDFDFVDDLLEESMVNKDGGPVLKKARMAEEADEEIPHHIVTTKIVLKKKDQDYFEVLPEGWVEVVHYSGMPVYLHKHSRVCSMSKPYFLGPGSARKHDIPMSAIPCLQYRKDLEREKEELKVFQDGQSLSSLCPSTKASLVVKVQSVEESKKKNSLGFQSVRDYCSRLFEFQKVPIRKFKTWADRRAHAAIRKRQERPSLPEGTKLITIPTLVVPNVPVRQGPHKSTNEDGCKIQPEAVPLVKKKFVMNPAGKSDVCVLHEFIQHSERVQPQYKFKELENPTTPYSATVVIKGTEYGVGFGSSKKFAKAEAARKTLEILIPNYGSSTMPTTKPATPPETSNGQPAEADDGEPTIDDEFAFFDRIKITDNRISDVSNTAGQLTPHQVLIECLKRNHGLGDTEPTFSVVQHKGKQLKNKFTMSVGEHSVSGFCKNSREGRQIASQLLLARLHPKLSTWGSLLRLYGRGSCKTPKEKKEEEQKITELQAAAAPNRPNYAILNKLREEMLKLHQNGTLDVVPDTHHLEAVHL